MRLTKYVPFLMVMTVLALSYIHMQVQIFDLAYKGKSKEEHIRELKEFNGTVAYNILKLKSANYLGNLLSENSKLRFRDQDSVVQLVTSDVQSPPEESSDIQPKAANPLLSFLPFRSQAEARAEERKDLFKPWYRAR